MRAALKMEWRLGWLSLLAALVLTGCGGGGSTPASCFSQAALPVVSFAYPGSLPILAGIFVDLSPTIQTTPGGSVAGVPLQFKLAAGGLPIGLTFDPNTGRIAGTAQGPPGNFPFTVRLTAACYVGEVTDSEILTIM